VKESGLIWIHKCVTVRHALVAEQDGADAVCIMGLEGAGLKNPATLTTLVSIAMAVRRVEIPLIAAGGIGNARTFLAALALGAEAVLLRTVFCAVRESPLSEHHKQALVEVDPYDPKWRKPILATPKPEAMERLKQAKDSKAVHKAARQAERFRLSRLAGIDTASLAIGFIDKVVAAKELIDGIIGKTEEILTSSGIGGRG